MKAEPNTRECEEYYEARERERNDPELRRKIRDSASGPRHGSTGPVDTLALMYPHVGYSRGSDPSM